MAEKRLHHKIVDRAIIGIALNLQKRLGSIGGGWFKADGNVIRHFSITVIAEKSLKAFKVR
jgi:hypothetical protein